MFRLAYVGSLYSGRGIEELIEAIGLLQDGGRPVRLEITGWGDSNYLSAISSLVRACGVEEKVVLRPPCRYDEVLLRYQSAHAGCALYAAVDRANDSLSNKLFECMAAGRAVLASDLPQTAEVVKTNRCGVVSEVAPEALAAAILQLVGSDIESMGRRSYQAFQSKLNWDEEVRPLVRRLNNLRDLGAT